MMRLLDVIRSGHHATCHYCRSTMVKSLLTSIVDGEWRMAETAGWSGFLWLSRGKREKMESQVWIEKMATKTGHDQAKIKSHSDLTTSQRSTIDRHNIIFASLTPSYRKQTNRLPWEQPKQLSRKEMGRITPKRATSWRCTTREPWNPMAPRYDPRLLVNSIDELTSSESLSKTVGETHTVLFLHPKLVWLEFGSGHALFLQDWHGRSDSRMGWRSDSNEFGRKGQIRCHQWVWIWKWRSRWCHSTQCGLGIWSRAVENWGQGGPSRCQLLCHSLSTNVLYIFAEWIKCR